MQCQLVILDLEGTLIPDADEDVALALADLGASCGLSITAERARCRSGMNVVAIVRACLEDAIGRPASPGVVAHLDAELRRTMRDRALNHSGVRAAAGVVDLLAALGVMGVPVGIVSGLHRPVVDALLDRMHWNATGLRTLCGDDVAEGRPSPAMLRAMMAVMKVRDPERVAVVGDSECDLASAFAAGCGLVAVPRATRHLTRVNAMPGVVMLGGMVDLLRALNDPGLAAGRHASRPSSRG